MGVGAVIFIYIGNQDEERWSSGGPHDGEKIEEFTVDLICFLRSKTKTAELAEGANDEFLDGLVNRIRATRNRCPTTIFSAGEGDAFGAKDIRVKAGMPTVVRLGVTTTFSTVRLTVLEEVKT